MRIQSTLIDLIKRDSETMANISGKRIKTFFRLYLSKPPIGWFVRYANQVDYVRS